MIRIDKKYLIFILYIIFHNLVLYNFADNNYSSYKTISTQGSQIEKLSGFSKVLIEKDIYPVKMLNNNLVMEDGISLQFGRKMHGYLLYYSNLITFGKIQNSILPLNFFFTVVTLITLFVSLSKTFDFIFACIATFLIQSHPWMVYEMYVNANINAYLFVLNIFLISIFFLIYEKKYQKLLIYYVFLSIICSFFYNVRELTLLCFFQLIISIFCLRKNLKKKLILTALTISIFILCNHSTNKFFEYKKNKAESYVKMNKGKIFDLDYNVKHGKWIPFHMSLNEFNKNLKTGFWDDKNTFSLIYRNIGLTKKEEHFKNNNINSSFDHDAKIFEKSKNGYSIHPHTYKETEEILKKDVFRIISNNYVLLPELFYKRVVYNIQNLTPITINLFNYNFYFFKNNHLNNIFIFLILLIFLFNIFCYDKKYKKKIKLMILFSIFISAPSIFFMATTGNNYSQYIHYIIFSYIISIFLKKGRVGEN
jgi:hypothetical protein